MDVSLTTSVLNEALSIYLKPEIFNTDQGLHPNETTTSHKGAY